MGQMKWMRRCDWRWYSQTLLLEISHKLSACKRRWTGSQDCSSHSQKYCWVIFFEHPRKRGGAKRFKKNRERLNKDGQRDSEGGEKRGGRRFEGEEGCRSELLNSV